MMADLLQIGQKNVVLFSQMFANKGEILCLVKVFYLLLQHGNEKWTAAPLFSTACLNRLRR